MDKKQYIVLKIEFCMHWILLNFQNIYMKGISWTQVTYSFLMQEHMQKLQTWSSSQTYAPQVVFDFHSLKSKRPASELKHKVATRSWLLINPSLAPPYRMPPWLQSLLHLCLFFLSARLPGASYYGQFRSSQGEDAQYLILQVRFICQLPNRS